MWGGEKKKLDLGKFSLVIYEMKGKKFEVIVDPRKVLEIKKEGGDPSQAIVTFDVFTDAQKGIRATEEELKEIIIKGMSWDKRIKGQSLSKEELDELRRKIDELDEDALREEASKWIVRMGNLKLPKYLRDELMERKVKQIVSYLQKYAINPSTKAPYPPDVLKSAIEKILSGEGGQKVHIDPLRETEEQLKDILVALSYVMPIKLEVLIAKIIVPARFVGQVYARIEKFGNILESDWMDDGSLVAKVEIPGGQFPIFNKEITDITKGGHRIEILERKVIG